MKFYSTILKLFVILSCGGNSDKGSYEIPNIEENIKAFINARKCFEKKTYVSLIDLKVKQDTLSVELADTYPKVKEMKFNYDTVLYGHRIIFTGDRIKGYSKNPSASKYPSDIIEISKKVSHLKSSLSIPNTGCQMQTQKSSLASKPQTPSCIYWRT